MLTFTVKIKWESTGKINIVVMEWVQVTIIYSEVDIIKLCI